MLTLSVTLTDPSGNVGNPETDNVTKTVNYRTAINTSAGTSTFTESSDGTPTSTIIDNGITILDPDNSTLASTTVRSEEHTSELQSLMRISYAVFCLKKK